MEKSVIERVNAWIKNSVTLKLITITILVLMLLIPTAMIKSIISEREELNTLAIEEVSSKWAESQQLTGPLLSVPLIFEHEEDGKKVQSKTYLHFLPDELNIKGRIDPEYLRRRIYQIVVYRSKLSISGSFILNEDFDQTDLKEIKWDKAFLTTGISDLRGIEDNIVFRWKGKTLKTQPGSKITNIIYSGFTVNLTGNEIIKNKPVAFNFDLSLQGSQNMSFIPVGSSTHVNITSDWPDPSFNGNFLPDQRDVSERGFEATWKILQINRNFPQTWIESSQSKKMNEASFGFDLLLPVDDYQKSMRSAKYGVMTIALTFLIFFLVEILNGRRIHTFQYILVGLALCLFYILLISISEHSNFNFAYLVSTAGVVTMISLYSLSVFKDRKLTLILTFTLIATYGFLFVILQLTDYALLMGSIGLALILGATMYFTRKIDWYRIHPESLKAD